MPSAIIPSMSARLSPEPGWPQGRIIAWASECRMPNAASEMPIVVVPVKAILAENDRKRGRHLSDKLHDEEDRHQGGDDGHAPGPPERSERVESLPGVTAGVRLCATPAKGNSPSGNSGR